MSLNISKLEHARILYRKTTARCPACAEAGHDQTQNHLIIWDDGRFGCVVYPGASPDGREHRKRIFALCGNRDIKPLSVYQNRLGRSGRANGNHSASEPLQTGLLGRLGRLFRTRSGRERTHPGNKDRTTEELNNFERSVPGVPSTPAVGMHRPLSERERAILVRAGAENDPIIFEALSSFDARVVG